MLKRPRDRNQKKCNGSGGGGGGGGGGRGGSNSEIKNSRKKSKHDEVKPGSKKNKKTKNEKTEKVEKKTKKEKTEKKRTEKKKIEKKKIEKKAEGKTEGKTGKGKGNDTKKPSRKKDMVKVDAAGGLLSGIAQRIPSGVIATILVPMMSTVALLRMQSTCRHFSSMAKLRMEEEQKRALPRIEWLCSLKSGLLSKKEEKLLGERIINNTRFCRHSTPRCDPIATSIQELKRYASETDGFLCHCHVRRFLPQIKKTVSGNDVIRRYGWGEPCLCLSARNKNADQKDVPVHPITGSLSEMDQKSLIATLKFTGNMDKVHEFIHLPHYIRAEQARFKWDDSAMPSSSSDCTLYERGASTHMAVCKAPPNGTGSCEIDTSTVIPIGADRNYKICGNYAWYVDPTKSERDQFYQILDIIRTKLLQPEFGGLRNALICQWLREKALLHLFQH